jgi:hypothetical protein
MGPMEMQLRTYTIHLFVNCMVVDLVYGGGHLSTEGRIVYGGGDCWKLPFDLQSCQKLSVHWYKTIKSCPFMLSLVCKNAPLINDQFQALLVCILWATVGESEHGRFKKRYSQLLRLLYIKMTRTTSADRILHWRFTKVTFFSVFSIKTRITVLTNFLDESHSISSTRTEDWKSYITIADPFGAQ